MKEVLLPQNAMVGSKLTHFLTFFYFILRIITVLLFMSIRLSIVFRLERFTSGTVGVNFYEEFQL